MDEEYPYTNWTFPPGEEGDKQNNSANLTVYYGDTVDVSWTSTFEPRADEDPYLALWCGESNIQRESKDFAPKQHRR